MTVRLETAGPGTTLYVDIAMRSTDEVDELARKAIAALSPFRQLAAQLAASKVLTAMRKSPRGTERVHFGHQPVVFTWGPEQ